MAHTMAAFLTLATPGIDKVWFEEEPEVPTQHSQVFNVETQDELYTTSAKMAGFEGPQQIDEGGDPVYVEAITPVTRRYDLLKYGEGYKITEKLWKFDRYGEVQKFEAALRRADDYHTEQFCFNILNSGTGTTISTGFDTLALFSTAHTRMDGGSNQANKTASNVVLSLAGLQDAVIAFKKMLDDRGRRYLSLPKQIIIPTDLEMVAAEILESEKVPTSANNAVNVIRKYGITPLVSPFITSTTFWALLGTKHDMNIRWNQKPTQKNMEDFNSNTILRKTEKWLGRGHGEWRGTYLGST